MAYISQGNYQMIVRNIHGADDGNLVDCNDETVVLKFAGKMVGESL